MLSSLERPHFFSFRPLPLSISLSLSLPLSIRSLSFPLSLTFCVHFISLMKAYTEIYIRCRCEISSFWKGWKTSSKQPNTQHKSFSIEFPLLFDLRKLCVCVFFFCSAVLVFDSIFAHFQTEYLFRMKMFLVFANGCLRKSLLRPWNVQKEHKSRTDKNLN